MKLLLINPPQIFSKYQVATGIVPPLGLAYLASFAIQQDIEVEIVDALGEAPDIVTPFREDIFLRGLNFSDITRRITPDVKLIGISNLFSFAFPAVQELVSAIKEARSRTPVVLGGPHPTHLCDYSLQNTDTDYVIFGEGEIPLVKLWQHIMGQITLSEVPSLAYINAQGVTERTVQQPRIKDLDQVNLPFPARHLLPMEKYIDTQEAHGAAHGRWTTILSSRGCPYGCTFCDSRRTKFVARSAQDVVDELEYCYREYGITEFHFEDDNMTLKRNRVIEICDEIIARNLKIAWQTPNGIRASVTTKEMLKKMKASGCSHITLAPESGSNRVLTDIIQKGKDFSLDQLADIARNANKLKIKSAAYFILGLPGETIEDIKQTIKYARTLARIGVDEAAFGLFIPLPGTPLWDQVVETSGQPDFLDLLVIGDLNKAKSWTEFVTDTELNFYRRKAYLVFQLTRMIYHPLNFMRTLTNIVRGISETKTENRLLTFIKRYKKTSELEQNGTVGALYTSYNTQRTVTVLLKTIPIYAYSYSAYKSILIMFGPILSLFKKKKS